MVGSVILVMIENDKVSSIFTTFHSLCKHGKRTMFTDMYGYKYSNGNLENTAGNKTDIIIYDQR